MSKNNKTPNLSAKEMANIKKEIPISYKEIENVVKYIQGKTLTVIEASIQNPNQLKAIKDLVKHIFSEQLTKVYNYMHPNCTMLSESDMVRYSGSVEKFQEDNIPEEFK